MATHLDLEEQEQLEQLKAFWKQYGNLITWLLVLLLGGYAAWNGWNLYQRDQGSKAGSLYDELDRAAQAGDSERATRIFADMKDRYPGATFTQQAGLVAARSAADKGRYDAATASLAWVADKASDDEYPNIARLFFVSVPVATENRSTPLDWLAEITLPAAGRVPPIRTSNASSS